MNDELITVERSAKWTKCQPDQWSDGDNLSVLKQSVNIWWISTASMTEELMRPQLHIAMLDEFGMQPFPKTKMLIINFEDYKRLRKQVVETPAQPAGKQGPY